MKIGVAQGRFHIIHYGHMEYLIESYKRCDYLLIGISDMDPSLSYFDYSHFEDIDKISKTPMRLDNPIYPFTFYERMQMIKLSMLEYGVDTAKFDITPFPIHKPWLIKYYIPLEATIYVTIYDQWGESKVDILNNYGFKTEVLWRRSMEERLTTGTEVRRRLLAGEDISDLVPGSVYRYLCEYLLKKC
ncbi:MAG: hypothetical protein N3C60_04245 [Calditerrivibrio sp.]|nr:hypothetical protein [Calditerrivibrio sp.]